MEKQVSRSRLERLLALLMTWCIVATSIWGNGLTVAAAEPDGGQEVFTSGGENGGPQEVTSSGEEMGGLPSLTGLDQFGTMLFDLSPTNDATNPNFTIESYLEGFQEVQQYSSVSGTRNEKAQKGYIEIINTKNKILPENKQNNNHVDVKVNDGKIYTESKTVQLFEDEGTSYRQNPQIMYMDRLYNNSDYTLESVLVKKEGESDYTEYPVPDNQPELIRFTNNPDNVHRSDKVPGKIQKTNTSDYKYHYTILIEEGTKVKLLFKPTEDHSYTSKEKVTFYDYDISDGKVYNSSGKAITYPTKQQQLNNNEYFIKTRTEDGVYGLGINSGLATNKTGQYAFGNSNCGTGLGEVNWEKNALNTANQTDHNHLGYNVFAGCTFGLVNGLNKDETLKWNSVTAPEIFKNENGTGRTVYNGWNLIFDRVGGTYTLKSVVDENGSNVTHPQTASGDLTSFHHPGIKETNTTHTHIWTNDFWPMDNSATHGTPGHDVIWGSYALDHNSKRKYLYGGASAKLPIADDGLNHNCFFGMTYSVNFTIDPGYVGPLQYYFYGDDDMWVFLQKKNAKGEWDWENINLIADIGGVHSSVGTYVDLWDWVNKNPITSTTKQGYRLLFYYTERGASGSTCYMRFTLPLDAEIKTAEGPFNLKIEKAIDDTLEKDSSIHKKEVKDATFMFKVLLSKDGHTVHDIYPYTIYNKGGDEVKAGVVSGTELGTQIDGEEKNFELADGQYVVIEGLPIGTEYEITETGTGSEYTKYAGLYDASYQIGQNNGGTGDLLGSAQAGTTCKASLGEGTGIKENSYVKFTNTFKDTNVEIKKTQSDNFERKYKKKEGTTIETLPADEQTDGEIYVIEDDTITYYLTVTNTSDLPATDVVVTDEIPEGLKLVETSISNGGVLQADNKTIEWKLGTLDAKGGKNQEKTVSFSVTVPDVTVITSWRNRGKVTYKDPYDKPGEPSHRSGESNEVVIKENIPGIAIEKWQSLTNESEKTKEDLKVVSGNIVTYYLAVTNNTENKNLGESVKNVCVYDEIPEGLIYVPDSMKVVSCPEDFDRGSVTTESDGSSYVQWTIGEIKPGETVMVSFQVEVPVVYEHQIWKNIGKTKYENDPHKNDPEYDPWTPSNEVVIETTTSSLTISKEVTGKIPDKYKDRVFKFKVELFSSKAGLLKGEYKYTYADASEAAGTITDGRGEIGLKAGQSVTITGLPVGARYTVTELIDDEDPYKLVEPTDKVLSGPITSEAVAVAKFTNALKQPKIEIHKTQSKDDKDDKVFTTDKLDVDGGDVVTYQLTVSNNGEGTAENVIVTDEIPIAAEVEGKAYRLEFVKDSITCKCPKSDEHFFIADNVITWELGNMASGASFKLTFQVKVPVTKSKVTWKNYATVESNNPDGSHEEEKSETVEIEENPAALEIEKRVDNAETNDEFSFDIILERNGKALSGSYDCVRNTTDESRQKTETVVFDDNGVGTLPLTLKHGETATIKGLPAGTEYTVVENQSVNKTFYAVSKEGDSGTIPAGATAHAVFVNTPQSTVEASLYGEKEVITIVEELAEYVLQPKDFAFQIETEQLPPNTIDPIKDHIVYNGVDGDAKKIRFFDNITFSKEGKYVYTIYEDEALSTSSQTETIWYDHSIYEVTIMVANNKGKLEITTFDVAKKADYDAVSWEPVDKNSIKFTNRYGSPRVSIDLEGEKYLKNKNLTGGEFSFELRAGEYQPLPTPTPAAAAINGELELFGDGLDEDEADGSESAPVLNCPVKVHQHSDDCYDENNNLICGYVDYVVHSHDDSCYDADGNLVCQLPENAPHVHGPECYAMEPELICGQEESAGHTHTADCYETALNCGMEEGEGGHIHTDECYAYTEPQQILICGLEENPGHIHTDACVGLICGLPESEEHVHTDSCYGYICGMSEGQGGHTHTADCYGYTEPEKVLICGQEESAGHVHTADCYVSILTCEQQEGPGHTHTADCYGEEKSVLICTIPENAEPHVHGEECFQAPQQTAATLSQQNGTPISNGQTEPKNVTVPLPADAKEGVKTAVNDGNGKFSFGMMTFTETGIYTYKVTEMIPSDIDILGKGITYDPKEYTVTITVKADENGKLLSPTIEVELGGTTIEGWVKFTNIYTPPTLTIEKQQQLGSGQLTTDRLDVERNNKITYYLTITNTSDTDATNVVVRDAIPTKAIIKENGVETEVLKALTYEEGSAKAYDESGIIMEGIVGQNVAGTLVWNFDVIKGKYSGKNKRTVSFTVTVPGVNVESWWRNQGSVNYDENPNDGKPPILSNEVEIHEIPENPENVKTEVTPGENTEVGVGSEITYTISHKNVNYDAPAADVIFKDTLVRGLDYVENSAYVEVSGKTRGYMEPDGSGKDLSWTVTDVPAGETVSVTFKARVNDSAVDEVTNTASVDNQYTNEVKNRVWKPVKEEVTPGEGTLVHPNDQITYTVSWKNYTADKADIVITDTLDPGVDFVEALDGGVYNPETRTVTWTLKDIPSGDAGKVTFTVVVTERALPQAEVENQAGVQVGNNPKVNTNIVENPTPELDKNETKPGNGKTVFVGDEITYEITWKNYHDKNATVFIYDTLDPGVDFVDAPAIEASGLSPATPAGEYDSANRRVTWTFPDMEAGAYGKVVLIVKVNEKATPAGIVKNRASMRVGNDAEMFTKWVENPTPKLQKEEVTPGDKAVVKPGDHITYKVYWRNYQDVPAAVTITDPLDPNVKFVSASEPGKYSAETHKVVWELGEQIAGAEGFVTLETEVLDTAVTPGHVDNQAGVKVGNDPEVKTNIVTNPVPNPEKTELTPGEGEWVEVGDAITYQITWRNYKEETADVVIVDPLDPGVDFVAASAGGKLYKAGEATDYDDAESGEVKKDRVIWVLPNQAAGANGSVTLTVKVNENATPVGEVNNQAFVQVGNDARVATRIIPNPTPETEKTEVTPGENVGVFVGDAITYEIRWTNYNNTDEAADVTVTDPLDKGVDFVSATNGGVYDKDTHTVTWTFPKQKPGAEGTVTLVVKVNANATPVGVVKNKASVEVENSFKVDTKEIPNPTPEQHKTELKPGDGEVVMVGDEITYQIKWKNYKSEKAVVIITDPLDQGLDYVSASPAAEYNKDTHTVTWNLGEQDAEKEGTVALTVKVNEKAVPAGEVINQAGVQVGNDPEVKTEIVHNPTPNPKKEEVTPGADEMVFVGDDITYKITWRNYRSEEADVVIRDPLDKGVDFVSASDGGVYDAQTHTVNWTLSKRAAGAEGYVTLVVNVNAKATPAGKVENQAFVRVGNDAEVATDIIENPTPNPKKEETKPGAGNLVFVGDAIDYEISWRNYEADIADVVITDPLDKGLDFVSAGQGGVYDAASHTVTWTLKAQPAGAEGKVTLSVKVNAKATPEGVVNNQAGVKVGNDPEVKTDIIPNPTPETEKTELTPGANELVFVGDEITYQITWKNYKEEEAVVTITDPLDKGVNFVSADNGGVYEEASHTVTWTLKAAAAGQEGSEGAVKLTVKVNEKATPVGEVLNQAHVRVANDPVVDTDIIENPTPNQKKEETVPGANELVFVGDEITYVITWRNYQEEAADVVITDPLDPGVDFVSANKGGVYSEATHTVTWTLADQPAGAEGTVELKVAVNAKATPAGRVENQAGVKVGSDPVVKTEIIPNPTPDPHKTEETPGANELVFVGDEITYHITWKNYKDTAAKVVITDKLDPGVDWAASPSGTYDPASHTVTWTLDNQPAHAEGTVSLTVRVNADATPAGRVENQAGVQVDHDPKVMTETIPNPTPQEEKEEVTPGENELVFVGDEIEYRITWRNYKEETATVVVTDPLDQGVDFVSAGQGGTYDKASHTVTWTLADQAAGAEGTLSLKVCVNEKATPVGMVENQAHVKVGNDPVVDTRIIPNPTPQEEKEEVTPGANELVFVGDEITYQITWRNYQKEAADVVITDPLDQGLDFVSADNGGTYDKAAHTVTWTLKGQEPGAEGKVLLTVKVNAKATPAGKVENQAGVKVGNDPEVKTEIIPNPTPETEKKEVTPGANELVFVGDTITYQITWKNYKEAAATVTITDPLDPGVDFVSADNDGVYDEASHTVTWTLKAGAAGEEGSEGTVELAVKVNAKATPVGRVENQAHVQVDHDPVVDTAIIPNPTPQEEKKEVTPGANKLVFVGDEITYEITWRNYQEEAADVVITDPLDKGLDFVSAGQGGVYDEASRTVTWTFADQEAGAEGVVELKVKVNANATPAGRVENQAGVKVGNDPVVLTEIIPNPTPNPEKEEVTPGADELVFVGDEITYEITWRNYKDEAAKVVITDPLDPGVDYVSSEGGTYDAETHTVTWVLDNRAAHTEGTVALTVKVNAKATPAGRVENQAHVQVGNDPVVDTQIIPNPTPQEEKEEVTPGADELVFVGDEIEYRITWRNYKEETATVVVTDPLDPGADFVSAGQGGTYDDASHTVTWTFADQAAGAEGTVTLKVKVNAKATPAGMVQNQASVKVGNDAEVKTEIIENPTPNPKKEETVPGADELVFVDDEITYEITWRNYREEAADVVITDPLDPGADFVSADNGGAYDPDTHTVTWTLKGQEPGAEGRVQLVVKVNAKATPAGKVENQAGVKVGNDAEVKTEIIENPTPKQEKTEVTPGEGEVVLVGDEITYEITWRNYKAETAEVVVTDPLDNGVDFVEADHEGVYNEETRTVTWTLGEQAAGAEGTVTLKVVVNSDATPVGVVENQAGVKVGNDPEVKTEIIENPTPSPKKEEVTPGADNLVFVGDEITYQITWKNYRSVAADVVITDVLDNGLTFVSADNGGTHNEANHTVTWILRNQEPGAEGVVELVTEVNEKATPVGMVANQASVKVGSDPAIDTDIIENPTPNPKKEETAPGQGQLVYIGDEITYQITWKNYRADAAEVVVTDPLDAGVDFVSADQGGTYDEQTRTVTWNLGVQEPDTEGVVELVVTVNENAVPAENVNNQAGVKVGNDPEVKTEIIPNPTYPGDPEKQEVTPGAGEVVRPGDEIVYAVVYRNYHTEEAVVTITDTLDPGLDFVSADNGGTYNERTRTVTWVLEGVAPLYSGEVRLTVNVNESARSDDYLVENQAGVQVGNDPVVDTNIIENPIPDAPLDGTIEVTKLLTLNGEPMYALDRDFYVALFADEEGTKRISDIKTLEFRDATSSTVTFDGIEIGRTYYVGEVDAEGNIMLDVGALEDGSLFYINFENESREAVVSEAGGVTTITFTNDFTELPDGFVLNGILNITKRLLDADGKPADSDEVFYAGIFDDPDFTQLSESVEQNIIPLELDGGSETTVSVRAAQYDAGQTPTFYVTEVYEDGTPIDDAFAYSMTIDSDMVVFSEEHTIHDVTITNQPPQETVTEATPTPTPEPGSGIPATPSPIPTGEKTGKVQTGDDTPIAIWFALMAAALALAGAGYTGYRRRNRR